MTSEISTLCARARDGDGDAIAAVCNRFVATAAADEGVERDVLLYVAEQVELQLHGINRAAALGLPRRRRGRPTKRLDTAAAADIALQHDPDTRRAYSLAVACAEHRLDGEGLTAAKHSAARSRGVSLSAVRRAWDVWGRLAMIWARMDRLSPTRPESPPPAPPKKVARAAQKPVTANRRRKSAARKRVPRKSE